MEEKSIELKLIDEVSKDNLLSISSNIAEIGLDAIFDDGVLKDIPVLSTIIALVKTTVDIREKIFAKKVLTFLLSLKSIPLDKRLKFINEINLNPTFKQKLGETIIVLLDKIDNLEKPKIIGKLFKAYILEKISFEDFTKISSSISRIDINDLLLFARYQEEKKTLSNEIAENLAFNGFMSISIAPQKMTLDMTELKPKFEFRMNSFGRKFIEHGF